MPTSPKELPTLRDSKSPEQLDIFQRDVREVLRRLRADMDAEDTTLQAEITALTVSTGSLVTGVSSVTAGSASVTAAPTTGAVVVDVVPANFTGIPESGVSGLLTDLSARPTGSGTVNILTKWGGASTLTNSSVTDTGLLVTVANPLTVTGAGIFNTTLSVTGAITFSTMTSGSVLFAGTAGLVSQDNARFFWDNTNHRLGLGNAAPAQALHVTGTTRTTAGLIVDAMTLGSVWFGGASGALTQNNANFFWDNTNSRLGVGSGIAAAPTNPITAKGAGTSDMMSVQNTTTNQWATYVARDDGGTVRTAWGYGNSFSTDTPRASKAHWWAENGTDFVIMRGGSIPGTQLVYITNSNGNFNIGGTSGDPGFKLRVEGGTASTSFTVNATTAQGVITNSTGLNSGSLNVRNLDTGGSSSVTFIDASGPGRGGVGYGGSTMTSPIAHVATKNFLLSTNASSDWVFANLTRNEVTVGMTTNTTYIEQQNGSSAAVSSANTGRLRYNTTGQTYQVSENGGGYTSVAKGTGTANTITKWSNTTGLIADSLLTDNATTLSYNAGKFTVTAATGNTSVAGNITITGVAAGMVKYGTLNARLYIGQQVLTAASGTYTPSTGTKCVHVMMVGGGGGGGGALGATAVSDGWAGGGASGAYIEFITDPAATVTGGAFVCGAAGAAGAATPGDGGTGGDTTIVIQGTTYTAKGGTGGKLMNAAVAASSVAGGTIQAGSTATDISYAGEQGGPGIALNITNGASGNGGSSPFGAGGPGTTVDAVGVSGLGKGSGGGGAGATTVTGRAGGAGTIGQIIVREYA